MASLESKVPIRPIASRIPPRLLSHAYWRLCSLMAQSAFLMLSMAGRFQGEDTERSRQFPPVGTGLVIARIDTDRPYQALPILLFIRFLISLQPHLRIAATMSARAVSASLTITQWAEKLSHSKPELLRPTPPATPHEKGATGSLSRNSSVPYCWHHGRATDPQTFVKFLVSTIAPINFPASEKSPHANDMAADNHEWSFILTAASSP